jgi:hypothetical protein
MHLTARTTTLAMPLALMLAATLSSTASAQVATLVSPDETPEPGSVAVEQEFEFADRQEAILVFAQCMRDNGIPMDDPQPGQGGGGFLRPGGPGGRGFDELGEDFQVAQQACSPILEAARPELDPELEQERLEEQLLLAQCLRENGYDQYPDPVLGTDGRLQRTGRQAFGELGIDFRSETFQSARSTCAAENGIEVGGFGQGGRGGAGGAN